MRKAAGKGATAIVALAMSASGVMALCGCTRGEEPASTPLPTRQTTIDPVVKKLDAAQQEAERRRAEIDNTAK